MVETILERLSSVSQPGLGFILSISLGYKDGLSPILSAQLKNIGWYHIVVVSGFHIGVLYRLVRGILLVPVSLGYTLCFFRGPVFLQLNFISELCSFSCLCWFSSMVGFSPPVQRALISLVIVRLMTNLLGFGSIFIGCAAAHLVQVLLFPNSYFSTSNALSWGCVTILMSPVSGVKDLVVRQTILTFFVSSLIGQFSIVWILVGWCGGVIVYLALFLFLVLLVSPDLAWAHDVLGLITGFLHELEWSSNFVVRVSFPGRFLLLLVVLFGVNNFYMKDRLCQIGMGNRC